MDFLNLENEYEIAWGLYLVAALGCFWMWTFFTRWLWRYLREPLWVTAAAALFTPVQLSVEGNYVPAVIVVVLELVFKQNQDSWLALSNLAVVLMALFAVYLIFVLLRWLLLRQLNKAAAARQAQAAEAEAAA